LFSKGFDEEKFTKEIGLISEYSGLVMKCFHDPEKYQINTIDLEVLKKLLTKRKISDDVQSKFESLFNSSLMNAGDMSQLTSDMLS
jgi:hypothetical protein